MSNNRFEKSCYHCCLKHIGQAAVLYDESRNGYPIHIHLCKGHMAEAESEVLKDDPTLAAAIRHMRLGIDSGTVPDFIELLILTERARDTRATTSDEG